MVLRTIVLMVLVALVARRFWPRSRLPWTVPLAVIAVVLVVRTTGYLVGD